MRDVGDDESGQDDLIRRQENFAVEHLESAPAFFDALKADVRVRLPRLPWLTGDPLDFVQWLCSAEKAVARNLMLAVRRVLLKSGQSAVDEATRQAAIAVYMLCACRWTKAAELQTLSGRIVRVPQMLLNPIAVLSATLFGGGIFLRADKGNEPLAAHVYEVSPVVGENPADLLLREIYAKLCPEAFGVLDACRRDAGAADERERMLSAIRVRIDDIRYVEESSLTLIVNAPSVFEEAPWAAELQLKAFARDPSLAEQLFVISPLDLHHEIKEFWRALAKDQKSPGPTHANDHTKMTNMSSAPITIHATTVALSTGDHSPATASVTQVMNGPNLTDLLPLLVDLRAEVDKLSAGKLKESLRTQVEDIEQVVQTRPADTKSRIQKGLDMIKTLSSVADGAEKLVDVAGKVAAAAAPVLALLS